MKDETQIKCMLSQNPLKDEYDYGFELALLWVLGELDDVIGDGGL